MSNVIGRKMFSLRSFIVLSCLFCFAFTASQSLTADEAYWGFQSTGFMATGSPGPQTAIAMRDGQVWPVVFSETSYMLQAYSLYPVENPANKGSNWFKIGTNLLQDPGSAMLSAATSSDGRFGAVLRSIDNTSGTAIIGSSPSGFLSPMMGVQAIDFDSQGNLLKGTLSTLPTNLPHGPLVDIAATPWGDIGVIDSNLRYFQRISMADGVWGSTDLTRVLQPQGSVLSDSLDLAIDSKGRPHVLGIASTSGPALVSFDFDVHTGLWTSQTLDFGVSSPYGATVAADGRGGVGAAWVSKNPESPSAVPTLMYAYNDGDGWNTQVVATGVTVGTSSQTIPLYQSQGVGLTYDAENLPVISFTAQDRKIWVAYDPTSPIASVPEPSSILLLVTGLMLALVGIGKAKFRR
jgi:hypothetical protein